MLFEHRRAKKWQWKHLFLEIAKKAATLVWMLWFGCFPLFLPVCPLSFFSVFWDEQSKKIMGMPVFFEFFFILGYSFSAGTKKIISKIMLLLEYCTLVLSFFLCIAFFYLCSVSFLWFSRFFVSVFGLIFSYLLCFWVDFCVPVLYFFCSLL